MQIQLKNKHKSIPQGISFELPEFSILTGKNGSGKTHLLEAISNSNITTVKENEKVINKIKIINFNQLIPRIEDTGNLSAFNSTTTSVWNQFKQGQAQLESQIKAKRRNEYSLQDILNSSGLNNFSRQAVKEMIHSNDLDFLNLNEEHFRKYLDVHYTTQGELFQGKLPQIFKSYQIRLEENKYNEFRKEKYGEKLEVFTEEEFYKFYGTPPWDLVNELLEYIRLPYRVNNPLGERKDTIFKLEFKNTLNNEIVHINHLSTGEKVLLSLVLAIYNCNNQFEIETTNLLLLDEPDAPLHPEFSKILVEVIKEFIVKKSKINVLLTTHSPATVISGENDDIFEMNNHTRTPIKKSKSEAIAILIEGVNNLRISKEERRQVFVESKNDVIYYEKFLAILEKNFTFCCTPHFLAPHNKDGSNCEDVKEIVKVLTSLGNDLVYGIIDYDNSNQSSERILVLGEKNRYSIENYIFDPIIVGFLLVRENIITTSEMGLDNNFSYINLKDLSETECQIISNFVLNSLNLNTSDNRTCKYLDGKSILINEDFLKHQGHELEELIINTWKKLGSITRGNNSESRLKKHILDTIIKDFETLLSEDILYLINQIK